MLEPNIAEKASADSCRAVMISQYFFYCGRLLATRTHNTSRS
jgi:hypothetical protein